jgi:hypothetical protein
VMRFNGVCIYLDGLSKHIHGNPMILQKDQTIRQALRSKKYVEMEITATELSDKNAMMSHFYQLGRILLGKDQAKRIKDNED